MARPGVTYYDVSKAAASLTAQGDNPTVDSVRDALGSTGSRSTIAPLLKRWKAEHQDEVVAADSGLPADLLRTVQSLYETLQADAAQKVEAAQAEYATARQELAIQLAQVGAQNAALTRDRDTQTAQLVSAHADQQQQATERRSLESRLTTALTTLEGLEQRLSDRTATIATLKQQLGQAHHQFEHYQTSTAAQRQEENHQAAQHVARLERELKDTRRSQHDSERELVQRDAQLTQLTADRQRLVAELTVLRDAHQPLQLEHQTAMQQLAMLTETTTIVRNERDAAIAGATTLRSELAVLRHETQRQAAQLHDQLGVIETLRDDHLTAVQEKAQLEGRLRQWQHHLDTKNT